MLLWSHHTYTIYYYVIESFKVGTAQPVQLVRWSATPIYGVSQQQVGRRKSNYSGRVGWVGSPRQQASRLPMKYISITLNLYSLVLLYQKY
jgi:hypothetical protein